MDENKNSFTQDERRSEANKARQGLWEWLRKLKEYKQDYVLWKQQVSRGKCLTHRIIFEEKNKTKAFSLKAPKKIQLRLSRKITKARFAKQEKWIEKWGFYPLINPAISSAPFAFDCFVRKNLAKGFFDSCVKLLQPSSRDIILGFLSGKFPPAPNGIFLWIDYRQSNRLIQERIGITIDTIRKAYKIEEARPRIDVSEMQIKAYVLKKIGYSKRQARKHLKIPCSRPDAKESFRKKLERVLDAVYQNGQ